MENETADDAIYVDINKESNLKFDDSFGDIIPVKDFIRDCESGCLIDYDGYSDEIIWNGNIIGECILSPSDVEGFKGMLLELEEELSGVSVVWYNK